MSNPSIIFVTEGGHAFGYGHIVRCKALPEAFRQLGSDVPFFVQGDSSIQRLIEDFPVRFETWHANETQLINQYGLADICIIDSYHATVDLYEQSAQTVRILAFFDDTNRRPRKGHPVIQ